jgi:hypothetical protein
MLDVGEPATAELARWLAGCIDARYETRSDERRTHHQQRAAPGHTA